MWFIPVASELLSPAVTVTVPLSRELAQVPLIFVNDTDIPLPTANVPVEVISSKYKSI